MVDDLVTGICKLRSDRQWRRTADRGRGKAYNCLWRKNEGTTVTTDLNVDDLGGYGRSEDKTDERDEHGWQVRVRGG